MYAAGNQVPAPTPNLQAPPMSAMSAMTRDHGDLPYTPTRGGEKTLVVKEARLGRHSRPVFAGLRARRNGSVDGQPHPQPDGIPGQRRLAGPWQWHPR